MDAYLNECLPALIPLAAVTAVLTSAVKDVAVVLGKKMPKPALRVAAIAIGGGLGIALNMSLAITSDHM